MYGHDNILGHFGKGVFSIMTRKVLQLNFPMVLWLQGHCFQRAPRGSVRVLRVGYSKTGICAVALPCGAQGGEGRGSGDVGRHHQVPQTKTDGGRMR